MAEKLSRVVHHSRLRPGTPLRQMTHPYRNEQKTRLIDYFNKRAPTWDAKKRWNAYYKHRLAALCKRLVPEGGSVLEVGCSTGELIAELKADSVAGLDMSEEMIRIARQKYPDVHFAVADI